MQGMAQATDLDVIIVVVTTISIVWGIIMMLEKEESMMKLYKVNVYLKDKTYPEMGWLVGRTTLEIANKIRTQSTVLLASSYREIKEAGYNMDEVQGIDGYNSSEIVKYHVEKCEVVPCSIK